MGRGEKAATALSDADAGGAGETTGVGSVPRAEDTGMSQREGTARCRKPKGTLILYLPPNRMRMPRNASRVAPGWNELPSGSGSVNAMYSCPNRFLACSMISPW